ncbi:hypothetical protein [Alteromonas lipolytica]|uniref:DUF8051 domain-containing protein n=1 Tax=Alteromonas lipolytica TaxID=1856405 RepID=A0A1E8FJN7_9ALTE|nr:hypothetical protein [Alteromonas lipolytica]OFI36159.1 hypothetical protein BFC17_08505 [Alteromonas lipolytica]GGF78258.1 hypothetical protein GCM10011338_33330 [Alteromonas lipolytica]
MHTKIAYLLVFSALALMILVPGGPIENRDFSQISPLILSLFNLFLTTLGLGSFMLAYFTRLQYRWAILGSWLAALSYLVVYAVDLARIFPASPTPMPTLLALVEVVGMAMALPILYWCSRLLSVPEVGSKRAVPTLHLSKQWLVLLPIIIAIALAIIVFATLAAMGRIPA